MSAISQSTTGSAWNTSRTWKEIAGMLAVAVFALSCVAAVNHSVDAQLFNSSVRNTPRATPVPEEPKQPETVMITCPTAGIFQAGNTPEGPALAKLGMEVKPETILGNIQPMDSSSMPILAGVVGTVKEIFVTDESVVSVGEALMKIEVKQLEETPEEDTE